MKSACAILTYKRLGALKETLSGMAQHCSGYPVAIFEDCGQADGTETFLKGSRLAIRQRQDLLAEEFDGKHIGDNTQIFLGTTNLGVTGNTNRALKWFLETGCDHLCLMNDDLHVQGDFVNFYSRGHEDLGVGLFCFCDFVEDSYRWMTVNSRGYKVKLCPRMTGIMMSMTRDVLDKIGYFDARFGRFGEEHCDFTIRARHSGFINLDGQPQNCLDLQASPALLKHQEVPSSLTGPERVIADREAFAIMSEVSKRYGQESVHRPYCLRLSKVVGGHTGVGIPIDNLGHYAPVDCTV